MSSVFDRTKEYDEAENGRALLRMLMEGTPALWRERYTWLPPHEAEEDLPSIGKGGSVQSDYATRAQRAVVEPYYQRAVKRDVATILGKPIVLKDDVPAVVRGTSSLGRDGWWENMDLRGNDGNVFLRMVVEDAVGDGGYSTVLVDHSKVPEGATEADLDQLGLRPYWRHFRARAVLEATTEVVNGVERLLRVRLSDPGPNGEDRVRVITAAPWAEGAEKPVGVVTWEWWEKRKAKDGTAVEEVADSGTMSPHQEIPLHPLYFGYDGPFRATPPYLHLAYLNLKHTRQDSDISEDLRISCGAQMHRWGLAKGEETQRAIGARRLLWSENDGAGAQWLERSGSAARVYLEFQAALEKKMREVSNEPFIRRTGRETATGRVIDTAEARTEVQARVLAVRDFVEQLLMSTAKYRGLESGGSVEVKPPPSYLDRDLEGLRFLKELHREVGVPRRGTLLDLAKEQGLLPDDFDVEREVALAETDGPPLASFKAPPTPQDRVAAAVAKANATMAANDNGEPGAERVPA